MHPRLFPIHQRALATPADLARALTATKVAFSGEPDCAEMLADLDQLIKKWSNPCSAS